MKTNSKIRNSLIYEGKVHNHRSGLGMRVRSYLDSQELPISELINDNIPDECTNFTYCYFLSTDYLSYDNFIDKITLNKDDYSSPTIIAHDQEHVISNSFHESSEARYSEFNTLEDLLIQNSGLHFYFRAEWNQDLVTKQSKSNLEAHATYKVHDLYICTHHGVLTTQKQKCPAKDGGGILLPCHMQRMDDYINSKDESIKNFQEKLIEVENNSKYFRGLYFEANSKLRNIMDNGITEGLKPRKKD